jgi:hypothetical protein
MCQHCCRRIIENKHSTEIGARLTCSVNAHTYARGPGRQPGASSFTRTRFSLSVCSRRRAEEVCRFNGGGVLVLNDPPATRARPR